MESTHTPSPPSKGRYKRYKSQNEVFEDWLKSTARQICKRTGNPTPIPSELNTRTTLELAQLIHEARERIAPGIIPMLKDIIRQRKEALACYRAFSRSQSAPIADTLQAANEAHQYYIEILQTVCKLLEPLVHRSSKQAVDPHTGDAMSNPFASLSVEEPSQDPFGSEKESTLATFGKTEATSDSEIANQKSWRKRAETMLGIHCYFQDMLDMRNYLSGLWTRFYQGTVSFQVASQLTNIAFHLMRDLDIELQNSFPNLCSMERILSFIDPRISNPDDSKLDKTLKDGPAMAKFFCIAGWNTVSDFIYAPATQASDSSTCVFKHPFAVELRKIRPELLELSEIAIAESLLRPDRQPSEADLQRLEAGGLSQDILTTQLLSSLRAKGVPSYLVVLIEVMLDIYDVFGGHSSFAYQILQDATRTFKDEMTLYIRQTGSQHCKASRKTCEMMMNQFSQKADMILDDKLFEKDLRLRSLDPKSPERTGIQPSKLFITLPLLAGQNLLSVYELRYVCAHSLMLHTPIMLCAGYLYKGAKPFSNKLNWPAMDFFIETHSKQKRFIRTVDDNELTKDKERANDEERIKDKERTIGEERTKGKEKTKDKERSKDKERFKDVDKNWKLFCLALGFSARDLQSHTAQSRSVPTLTKGILNKMRKVEVAHSWIAASKDVFSMAGNESGTANEFYSIIVRAIRHAQQKETVPNYDKLIPLLNDLEQTLSAQALELTFDYMSLLSDCQQLVGALYSGDLIFDFRTMPLEDTDFLWTGETVMWALKEVFLPNLPSELRTILKKCEFRRAMTDIMSPVSKNLGSMTADNLVADVDKPCNRWKMFARNSAVFFEEAAE